MGSNEVPFGVDRSVLRLDTKEPYLCLHFAIVYVRDQERALRFYVDKLGFRVAVDHRFADGRRWIEVSPPDGNANLGIAPLPPDEDPARLIQTQALIWFVTEDVNRKYDEWKARGVQFRYPPEVPAWGGIHTRFEDPDGNQFGLAGFDELTRSVESQRRALAHKYEAERRAAQEIEIAKQVQARLFPQVHPQARTLEYAGLCLQARQVGGDYFDFLDLGQQRLGLVIGDVSGKGIAAALLMQTCKPICAASARWPSRIPNSFCAPSTGFSTRTLPTTPSLRCSSPNTMTTASVCAMPTADISPGSSSARTTAARAWVRPARCWVCSMTGGATSPNAIWRPGICSPYTPTVSPKRRTIRERNSANTI